jgi:hypothetical protein
MHRIPSSLLIWLVASGLALPSSLWSQAPAKKTRYNEAPADINGLRTVVPAPVNPRPIRVAVYDGPGVFGNGVADVTKAVQSLPGSTIKVLGPEAIGTTDLSAFDVIAFTGGSGSKQAAAIGEAGKANVLKFVRGGGGYLGICGGSFLACSGFSWGLGVINAKTVSSQWHRGIGTVDVEMTDLAGAVFGSVQGPFKVRYASGPILQPDPKSALAPYRPVAIFRSEIAENGTPPGIMVNSPAAVVSQCSKGRVFLSSPHPEVTPGLEHLIPRALLWVAGQGADVTSPKPSQP